MVDTQRTPVLDRNNVAVLVPALNEALRIRDVVTGALAHCAHVIVVDDGSDDDTCARIADLPVIVLRHPRRMGKGASLRDGFAEALRRGFEAVLTMDGDGQHAADDILHRRQRQVDRDRAAVAATPGRLELGQAFRIRARRDQPVELLVLAGDPVERHSPVVVRRLAPDDPELPAVQAAIEAANSIATTPYIWGGGHGSFESSGYDCSGAVSFALHGGGFLESPLDSTGLETWGEAGPGKWITVYANASHAWMVIAGIAFDTVGGPGPRWHDPWVDSPEGFVVRHPGGY